MVSVYMFFAYLKATGNVLLDMEQQLHANSIRIKVLEQENNTLHSSLEKLRDRAQHNATTVGQMKNDVKCENIYVYYTSWFCGYY